MTAVQADIRAGSSRSPEVNECARLPKSRRRHLFGRWCQSVFATRASDHEKAWMRSRLGIINRARLGALQGRHWGKRCFVLGNGPSLKQTDLTLLRNEYVIGSNRIYLHPACQSWRNWYYCAVNPNVLAQYSDEIRALSAVKFLPWEQRDLMAGSNDAVLLRTSNEPRFSFDLGRGMWQGATVTYVSLQLAFHLGFTDVILLGVDHHYDRAGQPNKLVTADDPDPDHFTDDYFGPGSRWQLPDLAQSEIAYKLAKLAFEQEGRRIRDATIGGRLDVFRKASLEGLL